MTNGCTCHMPSYVKNPMYHAENCVYSTLNGANEIPYTDLYGSPQEMIIRSYVRRILKHHKILDGVLEADLTSMILGLTETNITKKEKSE